MSLALLITRLCLAAVFSVAAAAKLRDTRKFGDSLVAFGAPSALAVPLAWVVPFVELAVALALLTPWTAWWASLAACGLLIVFAAVLTITLARGAAPECNCFGQLHAAPISWRMVGRNVGLAAGAGLVAAAGPEAVTGNPLAGLSAAEVATLALGLVAVALLGTILVTLRRMLGQQAALLERTEVIRKLLTDEEVPEVAEDAPVERPDAAPPVEGLPVGAPAPPFLLPRFEGGTASLADLLALGKPVLLLFVSPTCRPCKSLLPMVRPWEREHDDRLTVALISKGTAEDNQAKVARFGARHLLLQGESTVAEDYEARWTPAGVIVGLDGRLATKTTYGDSSIRALVEHALTTGAGTDSSVQYAPPVIVGKSLFRIGELAPRFSLPDLDGGEVAFEHLLAGGNSLLLFWDPGCRFCKGIADQLHAWEQNPPPNAPRLAVVASGDPDRMRDQRGEFQSPILLDEFFEVGAMYGSGSTPSAVLVDGDGRIASSLAVGGRNVLALAGARPSSLAPTPVLSE
jgi:thiol-disulfide isomerase/thioredoxin/uncharacterized membrane protein YphA (DoxX/SURF4 family)